MATRRSRKQLHILPSALISISLTLGIFVAPPVRASDFKVELLAPSSGTSLNSSERFSIKFRFTGGASTNANSCDSPNLQSFRLGVTLVNDENFAIPLRWRSTQGGTVGTAGGLTGIWKATVLPNGIECTLEVNNPQSTEWSYAESIDSNWFGTKRIQVDNSSKFKELIIAWIIDSKASISDRPQVNSTKQTKVFQITIEGDLDISIVGLNRAETVDNYKAFSVVAKLDSSIEIEKLYAWMPQGSSAERKNGELYCPQNTLVKKVTGRVAEYSVQCHLYLWLGINSNTKTLEISGILRKKQQGYYEKYESQPVTINVGRLGIPGFSVESVRYVSDSPSKKWDPPGTLTIEGRARFYSFVNSPFETADDARVELCIEGECKKAITGFSGTFSISMPASTKSVKWELRVIHPNLPVFGKFSFRDDALVNDEGVRSLTGTAELPDKPEKAPKTSLKVNMSSPQSVKWGRPIPLSVSLKGSGSAECRLMFAYPTSGYSYRPLDSGGVRPFTIKGGQTLRLNAFFSRDFKARWYVVLSCVDRRTGAQLASVERYVTNI